MKTYDWIYVGLIAVAGIYVGAWWWLRRWFERRKGRADAQRWADLEAVERAGRTGKGFAGHLISWVEADEIVREFEGLPARRYGLRHDATDQWVIRREVMGRWQFELVEHPVQWWPIGEALMIRRDAEEELGQIALEPLPVVAVEPGAN